MNSHSPSSRIFSADSLSAPASRSAWIESSTAFAKAGILLTDCCCLRDQSPRAVEKFRLAVVHLAGVNPTVEVIERCDQMLASEVLVTAGRAFVAKHVVIFIAPAIRFITAIIIVVQAVLRIYFDFSSARFRLADRDSRRDRRFLGEQGMQCEPERRVTGCELVGEVSHGGRGGCVRETAGVQDLPVTTLTGQADRADLPAGGVEQGKQADGPGHAVGEKAARAIAHSKGLAVQLPNVGDGPHRQFISDVFDDQRRP